MPALARRFGVRLQRSSTAVGETKACGGGSAARPRAATAPIAAAVRRNERRVEFPRILIVCFTSLHLEASCAYAYANQVELRKRLSPFFFPALSNKNSTSANEYGET